MIHTEGARHTLSLRLKADLKFQLVKLEEYCRLQIFKSPIRLQILARFIFY